MLHPTSQQAPVGHQPQGPTVAGEEPQVCDQTSGWNPGSSTQNPITSSSAALLLSPTEDCRENESHVFADEKGNL